MSLLCRWRERALEKAALSGDALPRDPVLQQHLSGCASCRRYWNELRALSAELSVLSEPLPSGKGFADAAWARVCAAQASTRPSLRFAPLFAAAVILILGFFLWNRLHLSSPTSPREREKQNVLVSEGDWAAGHPAKKFISSRTISSHTKKLTSSSVPSGAASSRINTASSRSRHKVIAMAHPKRRSALRRSAGTRTYARHYRRQRNAAALAAKRQTKPSISQRIVNVPTRPKWEQWSQWGAYYASQGDYQRAATAYASAYAERPDPELALAAGQAAENAGDVTLALTYYTRILNRPSAKKPPEKGSSLWNHANDTV